MGEVAWFYFEAVDSIFLNNIPLTSIYLMIFLYNGRSPDAVATNEGVRKNNALVVVVIVLLHPTSTSLRRSFVVLDDSVLGVFVP